MAGNYEQRAKLLNTISLIAFHGSITALVSMRGIKQIIKYYNYAITDKPAIQSSLQSYRMLTQTIVHYQQPVRFHPTSSQSDRPKSGSEPGRDHHHSRRSKSIRHHSGTSRIKLISQVGDSVALVGDSEEDVYYRSDSMKSVGSSQQM